MNPAEALKRWLGAVTAGGPRLAQSKEKLAEHLNKTPTTADAAEHRKWLAVKRELEDHVSAEEAALATAEQYAAEAKAAAKDAEDRATVAEYGRETKAMRPEILKVFDFEAEIAKRLPAIVAHVARGEEVAKIAARLGLPPVIDAERELREIPARVIPADVRAEMAWINAAGERPSQLSANAAGELMPADHRGPYSYRKVEVVQSAERFEPARLPPRLATAVKLVGLKGEPLWPR